MHIKSLHFYLFIYSFIFGLYRPLSVAQELLSSQDFYGHRCLILTLEPMPLKMTSVSCELYLVVMNNDEFH